MFVKCLPLSCFLHCHVLLLCEHDRGNCTHSTTYTWCVCVHACLCVCVHACLCVCVHACMCAVYCDRTSHCARSVALARTLKQKFRCSGCHSVKGLCSLPLSDEGSCRLPKHLNYCFSVLASTTNQSNESTQPLRSIRIRTQLTMGRAQV